MASLSAEARAARLEARRARSDSHTLRLTLRGNLERSRECLGRAQAETDKAHARRLTPLPSPWSDLPWSEMYETLDRTLVPLD